MADPRLEELFAAGLATYEQRQAAGKKAAAIELPPKVLTIWQPWAWAVVNGSKRIENRGSATAYRGRLLIHVGQGPKTRWEEHVKEALDGWPPTHPRPSVEQLREQIGTVIGEVTLVGCEPNGQQPTDPWAVPGQVGWRLACPRAYARPFALRGQQGLFALPHEHQQEWRRAGLRTYRLDDFDVRTTSASQAVAACYTYGVRRFATVVKVNGSPLYFGLLVSAAARFVGDDGIAEQVEGRMWAAVRANDRSPATGGAR